MRRIRKLLRLVPLFVMTMALSPAVCHALDIYLKIAGIDGDSLAVGHAGWIDVVSLRNALQTTITVDSGRPVAGLANFSPISLIKPVDRSTPKLQENLVTGNSALNAIIEIWTPGPTPKKIVEIYLEQVFAVSVDEIVPSGDLPTETVSLYFTKYRYTFFVYASDVKLTEHRALQWNILTMS